MRIHRALLYPGGPRLKKMNGMDEQPDRRGCSWSAFVESPRGQAGMRPARALSSCGVSCPCRHLVWRCAMS